LIPFYWEVADATSSNVYANFADCYNKNLKAKWTATTASETQNKFGADGFNFFSTLEEGMECSGACWKPLFGISRPIADGPVTKQCVDVIIDSLGSSMAPTIVCLVTFIILLGATCCSLPLCSGFDSDEADDPQYA